MKWTVLIILITMFAMGANAAMHTETVEYKEGETTLEGYLVYDDATTDKRPGVLVVPAWRGVDDFSKEQAARLAEMGYVAFVADIFGKGVRPKTDEEAGANVGKYYSNRPMWRQRVVTAFDRLKSEKTVDAGRIVSIGYCFGGASSLELARSGADIVGVVSFHGALSSPTPEDAKNIKASILALHGADDPYVKPEEVRGFEKEMTDAKVDWQLVKYSGAVHSFTHPHAGNDNSKGQAYNEKAAMRSWDAMKAFFAEVLK